MTLCLFIDYQHHTVYNSLHKIKIQGLSGCQVSLATFLLLLEGNSILNQMNSKLRFLKDTKIEGTKIQNLEIH